MKKLLITVCLSGLLSVPSVVLGAETMAGASLYGSFRAGVSFGSGDTNAVDYGSRWGIQGTNEVSEGLTASYKYESKFNTSNAEFAGGVGHAHAAVDESIFVVLNKTLNFDATSVPAVTAVPAAEGVPAVEAADAYFMNSCARGDPILMVTDDDDPKLVTYEDNTTSVMDMTDDMAAICATKISHAHDAATGDGTAGGRLSYINLSGGFGTVTLGQNWSASALHYGFAVDGSIVNGSFGGATGRNANTISYASNAGDVSFQIDKVTGMAEALEIGATAVLGPVGIGLGYWKSGADVTNPGALTGVTDGASFTGIAISVGAGGVDLSIGLGSENDVKNKVGEVIDRDTSVIKVGGSLGDSGVSYVLQVANSDDPNSDQNTVSVTNDLGGGASLILEHLDPGVGDASTFLGLKVDF